VKGRFGVSVSLISSSSLFHRVATFSCSTICIDADSVSLILQSYLGGVAGDFQVLWLHDWTFSFFVSYKDVGLMIHHLRGFSSKLFCVHFTL
jgi:hypothetical protein